MAYLKSNDPTVSRPITCAIVLNYNYRDYDENHSEDVYIIT